jgi:hypothetical protein
MGLDRRLPGSLSNRLLFAQGVLCQTIQVCVRYRGKNDLPPKNWSRFWGQVNTRRSIIRVILFICKAFFLNAYNDEPERASGLLSPSLI